MPNRNDKNVGTEVAGLQVEVRDLRQAVEKNTESLTEVREGFHHLRGELNGVLPRLEEKVGRLVCQLDTRDGTERAYFEKTGIHERQIASLTDQVATKADHQANQEEHGRLWLAIKLFFSGTMAALVGLLVAKVLR